MCRTVKVITPKPAESVCHLMLYCLHMFSLYTLFCDIMLGPLCDLHDDWQIQAMYLQKNMQESQLLYYWEAWSASLGFRQTFFRSKVFSGKHISRPAEYLLKMMSFRGDQSQIKHKKMWKKICELIHEGHHWTVYQFSPFIEMSCGVCQHIFMKNLNMCHTADSWHSIKNSICSHLPQNDTFFVRKQHGGHVSALCTHLTQPHVTSPCSPKWNWNWMDATLISS